MRLLFLTSTPLDIQRGSGTFVGIETLAQALRAQGATIDILTPRLRLPVYTLERILYNETLRLPAAAYDATIGFDLDGYRLKRDRVPHIAALKGVIADEARFQKGMTKLTMSIQARLEAMHVRRADFVITTSRYAAGRIEQYYGVRTAAIVSELIDLARWREALVANPALPDPRAFTVLSVCRLYRRKRLDLLLEATARLRDRIPNLRVRIVGSGPEAEEFRAVWRRHRLEAQVAWLGDVSFAELAREYNACDLFCLPSMQEGFGIVFLEAMAAGKPILAAGAAAVPEVVPQGVLVEPGSASAIAEAIEALYRDEKHRAALAAQGVDRVAQFDAPRVAAVFLNELRRFVHSATTE
ncbi:MAG TPA: glycosyltransferase family 4 protein [Candidatus Sulfopaludibacter sp.]|nr:glycosyltransferase family 4 protein [Candidatus Sulfopaludibacter sp.]